MHTPLQKKQSPRSGMALVIVLGLVALLVISSVTFAILMRVERAGAANARNTIMARQVVKGALAYAIAAIDDEVATSNYPHWYEADNAGRPLPYWHTHTDPDKPGKEMNGTGGPREVRFWRDTFGSIDHTIGGAFPGFRAPAYLMTPAAEKYLPYAIRHRAYARSMSRGASTQSEVEKVGSEWIAVSSDTDVSDIVGRFAFLAFNTTGCLDLSAICAGAGARGRGADPSEIQLVDSFFQPGTTAQDFKAKNKKKRFDSVAEIIAQNPNAASRTGDVFAEGFAYSTFSLSPPDMAPAKTDAEKDKDDAGKPYRRKVCIGAGGDAAEQADHIRSHRARVMKAFYDSGLTESSPDYESYRKDVKEAACAICGTAAYTLPRKFNSEQAHWAYLALVDYVDPDYAPEGKDDVEKFARPATEATPLFNGFMATVKFTCEEVSRQEADPDSGESYDVFDESNCKYTVEVNGKVAFANRMAAQSEEPDALVFEALCTGRLGLLFQGGGPLWEVFYDGFQTLSDDIQVDKSALPKSEGFLLSRTVGFDDGGSVPFSLSWTSESVPAAAPLVPGELGEERAQKLWPFPASVFVGAAGSVKLGGEVVHQVPATFDDNFQESWLVSQFETAVEGKNWANAAVVKVNPVKTVRKTSGASSADYDLQKRVVNLVIWGEMIDPRFSTIASADYLWCDVYPRVAIPSHVADEGSVFRDFSLSKMKTHDGGLGDFHGADFLLSMMEPTEAADKAFDAFVVKFNKKNEYYGDGGKTYFYYDDNWLSGYSQFQKFMLTHGSVLKWHFKGHVDGSRLAKGDADCKTDDFESQWHAMHVKNDRLETVGELGCLPVGPYATIRLAGFQEECEAEVSPDKKLCPFNKLPAAVDYQNAYPGSAPLPYHPVLDFFTLRDEAVRGLVNPNAPDPKTLAAVFNDMPIGLYGDGAVTRLSDDDAVTLAETLQDSWAAIGKGEIFSKLSQLGWLFASDDLGGALAGGRLFRDNHQREEAIQNSCGLFSAVRGQTYTLVLRGEAFSPLFGRQEVRDGRGTTHASRTAIAQIWRDSEEDSEGRHPIVLQFFKILDD